MQSSPRHSTISRTARHRLTLFFRRRTPVVLPPGHRTPWSACLTACAEAPYKRERMITIPADLLGREVDLGTVTVTAEMIAAYVTAVGEVSAEPRPADEAPPTFCLALRRGMTPDVQLPPDMFGVYGGHDLEFHHPIRAGGTYRITGRITDVYEKIGRSGTLTVVVREATIRDGTEQVAARIVERQIVRRRPSAASSRSGD